MEEKRRKKKAKPYNRLFMKTPTEYMIIFVVLFMVVFGIVMVYSSSFYSTTSAVGIPPYIKQGIFAIIGFLAMYSISKVRLTVINKFVPLGYLVTIVLLISVLFIADDVKGAKRWIPIMGFNLQPSEIAKFTMILVVGLFLTKYKMHLSKRNVIGVLMLILLVPLVLIGKEDMSAAIVVMGICAAMIFVAYKDSIQIVLFGVVFGGALSAIFLGLYTYRMGRLKTFLEGPWADPDGSGRQIIQALYAIGSGGLTGIGLGQSIQKMGYISEAHNDIIFAIICEELGLLGGIAIVGLYVVLIYRIMQIALTAVSMEHFLIAVGVMVHIGFQAFINIGVATSLIPTTGMPLPFISYGGSSLIMFLAEIGLVLNVARNNHIEEITGGEE